jgi:hemerythrin-like metal-binding protein
MRCDESLQAGDEVLQEHHRRLTDVAQSLYEAQRAGLKEQVLARLRELMLASAQHFVFEEELMARTRYPNSALHTEHHGEMLTELERFFERALADELADPDYVLGFVSGWLTSHLLTFDRELIEFMREPQRDSPSIRST